jgi:GMP synthase-like glutamine amidotransferase
VVSRDPKGWELGVHPITLTHTFLDHFGSVTSNPTNPSQLRLQFVHADHVVFPTLPEGFHSIGRSDHCALQGVWKKGRVLTYQGHAEFDRFINSETLKIFGKSWETSFRESALQCIDRDDDAMWAAEVMLKFFLEETHDGVSVEGKEGLAQYEEDVMARL